MLVLLYTRVEYESTRSYTAYGAVLVEQIPGRWLDEDSRHTSHDFCARPVPKRLATRIPERIKVGQDHYCKARFDKEVRRFN